MGIDGDLQIAILDDRRSSTFWITAPRYIPNEGRERGS